MAHLLTSSNLVVCGYMYVCAMLALSPGKGFGDTSQNFGATRKWGQL